MRLIGVTRFKEWVEVTPPGATIVYAYGYPTLDMPRDENVMDIAREARAAYHAGRVMLFRRRCRAMLGGDRPTYDYMAVRVSKPVEYKEKELKRLEPVDGFGYKLTPRPYPVNQYPNVSNRDYGDEDDDAS